MLMVSDQGHLKVGCINVYIRKPQTLNQSAPGKPAASASSSTAVTLIVLPKVTIKMSVAQMNGTMRRRHTIEVSPRRNYRSFGNDICVSFRLSDSNMEEFRRVS
jgi:hypothetical protein